MLVGLTFCVEWFALASVGRFVLLCWLVYPFVSAGLHFCEGGG